MGTFKNVMEKQLREENITKEVVKIIKNKPSLVRDTVEKKKSVIVFGLSEETLPIRQERETCEKRVAKGVLTAVQGEDDEAREICEEIEEVTRIGKFEEDKQRPMRIRLRLQVAAERLLAGSWRLASKEEYMKVWVRCDLNEDERAKLS